MQSPSILPVEATALGYEIGRTTLPAMQPSAVKRTLEAGSDVLPELDEAPTAKRSVLLHPAFLLSVGLTLLSIGGLVAWLIINLNSSAAAASSVTVAATSGNVRVSWSGPNVPYELFVIDGPAGEVLDVSQLVSGREAWIPRSALIVDDGSCFVVRPAERAAAAVSLEKATLDAQGASSACVAD
ncbi:hypothetical protein GCM10027056_27970 [Glaciibacter psychrotolerans]